MKKYTLIKHIPILKNHTQRTTNISHNNKQNINQQNYYKILYGHKYGLKLINLIYFRLANLNQIDYPD